VGLSITHEIARYYNLPVDHGVLITKVADGSPAEAAAMEVGDIILQINNVDLLRIEDLVEQVHKKKVSESVGILILHDDRKYFLELKLGKAS
jgi:serine protease Do